MKYEVITQKEEDIDLEKKIKATQFQSYAMELGTGRQYLFIV